MYYVCYIIITYHGFCAEQNESVIAELRTKLKTAEEHLQTTNRGISSLTLIVQ